MDLLRVYQSRASVYTKAELSLLYPELSERQLSNALYYAVKEDRLARVRRGMYAKPGFDIQELACKLCAPAYVSLETVLLPEGVIFQLTSETHCVSRVSRRVEIEGERIVYRKLKDTVLTNPEGVINDGVKSVASLERALLDVLALDGERYLDNLRPVSWEKVRQLLPLYNNRALTKRVRKLEENEGRGK